jgi:undecaprenyl diphosphate synthase
LPVNFVLQSKPPAALVTAPRHVAIIMDGNGRWAERRGLPRTEGHRAGAGAVRRAIEAAPGLGIEILTLYAFSSDNWRRPSAEVAALMRLLALYLESEVNECVERGVRLSVIGRRDRLPRALVGLIESAERRTCDGSVLTVRLAIDYSARQAIVCAARRLAGDGDASAFAEELSGGVPPRPGSTRGGVTSDVDLLIRTGGERRLSDFMLWESAYAELHFTDRLWPDFGADALEAAVADFLARERRFGGLPRRPRTPDRRTPPRNARQGEARDGSAPL